MQNKKVIGTMKIPLLVVHSGSVVCKLIGYLTIHALIFYEYYKEIYYLFSQPMTTD